MYYNARVRVKFEDDNGKLKKKTESYLVSAVSVTDAEAIVHSYFEKYPQLEYDVRSVSISSVVDVLSEESNK